MDGSITASPGNAGVQRAGRNVRWNTASHNYFFFYITATSSFKTRWGLRGPSSLACHRQFARFKLEGTTRRLHWTEQNMSENCQHTAHGEKGDSDSDVHTGEASAGYITQWSTRTSSRSSLSMNRRVRGRLSSKGP